MIILQGMQFGQNKNIYGTGIFGSYAKQSKMTYRNTWLTDRSSV